MTVAAAVYPEEAIAGRTAGAMLGALFGSLLGSIADDNTNTADDRELH